MIGVESVIGQIGHHVWGMNERKGHGIGGMRSLVEYLARLMGSVASVAEVLDEILLRNDAQSGLDEIGESELVIPSIVAADLVDALDGCREEPLHGGIVGEKQFVVFLQFRKYLAINVKVFPDSAP